MIRIYVKNWAVDYDDATEHEVARAVGSLTARGFEVQLERECWSPDGNGVVCSTEAEYDACNDL